jgi:EAL and modified HD-GYP domain-containing signal transduction protein
MCYRFPPSKPIIPGSKPARFAARNWTRTSMKTLFTREPIFDTRDQIAGYEIFCRSEVSADRQSIDRAAGEVAVRALLGFGFPRIADGHRAFITVTRELLVGGAVELVDPHAAVIQLLDTIEPDAEVVAACQHYLGLGYTIALDRFTHHANTEALLSVCGIVGIDVSRYSPDELTMQLALLRPFGVEFLADKVNDEETHKRCVDLGFRYFQGAHFSHPETLAGGDISVSQIRTMRVMRLLQDLDAADRAIEEEFRRDVALSFKLLRIVNSAAVGGRGVRSIHHAMRLLGRESLYRWLSLLLIPGDRGNGVQLEALKASLTRARFCELLGDATRRPLTPGTLFLVGLLSSLETYFGLSLEDVLKPLDLATEISAALLGGRGHFGDALALVSAYQVGDWNEVTDRCETLGVQEDQLANLYLDSLTWAQERLSDLGDGEQAA